ncbi:MAG TPA: hypothetical protein VLJ39_12185 [Tepidisphaeraceae bacterium]|nr:hypothetical protein [Tepidisphaeraceae bacterium]
MSLLKTMSMSAAALLLGSAFLITKSDAAAPAAGEAPAAHHGKGRLTKPWNELKDLTEDEKTKILAIHQKAIDEIHDIEAKEHADILASLTEPQRKEVAEIEAKDKAAAHKKATTQPSAASAK